MAQTPDRLAQLSPAAGADATLYTATTRTVISMIQVCNRANVQRLYRVAHAYAGAAAADSQYLRYDHPIEANMAQEIGKGIVLEATDVLRVYVDGADLSFNVYGVKIT